VSPSYRHYAVDNHRRACAGFTDVVGAAAGTWEAPSPCAEWNARGVLEHVIGFHDVLVLRPLGAKPTRPKDDPAARWALTVEALFSALGSVEAVTPERVSLLEALTTEVLVHTWDIAKAVGFDVTLDEELCARGRIGALVNRDKLEASGIFGPPVSVPEHASAQDRLLGLLGRDPAWVAPRR
jgi:uncharacterized protein (TIGR03086 family)